MNKLIKKYKLNLNSKGFTLIELIATIAIISIISTVAIFSVTTVINNSKEKSLQTTYSSLKETAATLSKELPEDYWDIDGNTYVSCVSVRDMKNEGYYKEDDFENVDGIKDETFVIVKKDMNSKVIISSEIDADDSKYCSNNFNNANLKVKSYTPSTIMVEADCGADNYNYSYSYSVKGANDFKNSNSENKNGKVHTFTGLKSNTEYDLRVTCTKDSNSASKIGNVEQKTGISNNISFDDSCTPGPVPITITYKDGKDYYFKLTSTGSIDSKYGAKECTEIGGSCLDNTVTSIRGNTWYKVNNKDIKVSINNNGNIYVYSSSNDDDIKFSSSATATITKIDKSTPNAPTVTPSDGIGSGNWHKVNYNIKLSGGVNSNNKNCKGVTYEYSKDNNSFKEVTDNPLNKNLEENQIYYFRTKAQNGNISSVTSYNSKLDKTKPVCKISNISQIRKTHTSSVNMECTDTLSRIVYKNLSSSNFNTKNVSITSISSPQSISDGYKYTISFRADTIGTGSYIELKSNIIKDNAGNSNNSSKSNTFKVLPNTYTLTYNSNGGSSCSSKTVTYGEKYGTLCTPTRVGYTFAGWYTSSSGGNNITSESIYDIEGNQTIYAHWNVNYYYFDLNGYLDGSSIGWLTGYGTADIYINGSLVCNDCEDYYAQHPYGTKYEIKDIKQSTGHTYNGVYSGSLSGTITGTTAVSLKFSTNSYTITTYYYYSYLNSEWKHFDTKTDTRTYGSSFAPYNTYTPSGYYAGNNYRYYDSSGNYLGNGTVGSNSFTVTGNITVHVHYYPNNYYLDLNGYLDGSENGGIGGYGTADVYINGSLVCNDCTDYYTSHPYGTKYQITDIRATSGHTYNGVYSGSLSGTITDNTGVYLRYNTNRYTLTYNNQGGSGCSSKSVIYGGEIGSLCTPYRSGYTFKEWSTDSNDSTSSNKVTSGTIMYGDKTVYAIWLASSINDYRCNKNDGTLYFITGCDGGNSAYCYYTERNGIIEDGKVLRGDLSMSSNGKTCNSVSYTSASTNGSWYLFRNAGYIARKACSTPSYSYSGIYSYFNSGCLNASPSEQIVAISSNNAPVYLKTSAFGYILGRKTVGGKSFYKIYIKEGNLNKYADDGCAKFGMGTCTLEQVTINGGTYYGVWIPANCKQDGVTCPASGNALNYSG